MKTLLAAGLLALHATTLHPLVTLKGDHSTKSRVFYSSHPFNITYHVRSTVGDDPSFGFALQLESRAGKDLDSYVLFDPVGHGTGVMSEGRVCTRGCYIQVEGFNGQFTITVNPR